MARTGKPRDRFSWQYITESNPSDERKGFRWKCNFCEKYFPGGASRIKAHLAKVKGCGIKICEKVSEKVMLEAKEALQGSSISEKMGTKRKFPEIESSHRSVPDIPQGITYPQYPGLDEHNGTIQEDSDANHETNLDVQLEQMKQSDFPPPIIDKPYLAESTSNVPPRSTGDNQESGTGASRGIPSDFPQSSSSSSVATESSQLEIFELAAQTLGRDRIVDEIYHSLTDQILRIGVYGMAGVGKTTIVKRLRDIVCEDEAFRQVLWVKVSKDCSLHELQNKLAMALCVIDDFKNVDKVMRPTFLNECLRKRGKCLVILDDLWKDYDLNDLGIKLMRDGFIQLVLTTRHQSVCQRMICEKEIEVAPLPYDDAWNLFEKTLGYELPHSRKRIAKDIVGKCGGLPLAVVLIAGHMRGVESDDGWNYTLEKLRQPEVPQHCIFPILHHIYIELDERQQQCFLLCALYPEDSVISRDQLIDFCIDEGVIRKDSMWKMYNEGNDILDELEKKFLLENVVYPYETTEQEEVRMHDVIRDHALHIMNSKGACIVKCGIHLDEIPSEDDWSSDLQRVSLVDNSFTNGLPTLRSNYPQLSTLLARGCRNLCGIPRCFFERTEGLKVIDMSHTGIAAVPESIINLETLDALILRGCGKLRCVPSLATLTSVRKLDLGKCELIDGVPDELGMLVNLTYLDLSGTSIKEITAGVVGRLHKLQYLGLGYAAVHGKEIAALKKLEALHCRFENVNELSDYSQHRQHVEMLRAYTLFIGNDIAFKKEHWNAGIQSAIWIDHRYDMDMRFPWRKEEKAVIILGKEHSTRETFHIPSDVTALAMKCDEERCNSADFTQLENQEKVRKCMCLDLLLPAYGCEKAKITSCRVQEAEERLLLESKGTFTLLQSIRIVKCSKMKLAVGPEFFPLLRNLKSVDIFDCGNIEEVIAMPSQLPPISTSVLPLLTTLSVSGCPKMRRLLTLELFMHLPNLERITVEHCVGMKEVIGHELEHGVGTSSSRDTCIFLPTLSSRKLLVISVSNAPELENICEVTDISSCIRMILISKCPKLKRIPSCDDFISRVPEAEPFVFSYTRP